jgi:hypothetical protein
MPKFAVREWAELISDPISMGERDKRIFDHADLPAVNDKLSITLRLKINKHRSNWATIFHKGRDVGLIKYFYQQGYDEYFY